MSASIYIQPVKGTNLNLGGPSGFLDLLRKVFQHDYPYEFSDRDISTLQTMSRCTDQTPYKEAIDTIVQTIETFGIVRLWAEW